MHVRSYCVCEVSHVVPEHILAADDFPELSQNARLECQRIVVCKQLKG